MLLSNPQNTTFGNFSYKWLGQRSLAQVLDWFDCIETTQVKTAMGSYRWSTESVARDRMFLQYLGVTF
ncbi:MAG: hypothetical protein HGA97_01170 [Chlorobiaceae bacterium]|nr:hypothetical protein [Chlorobiaceae bacterium]